MKIVLDLLAFMPTRAHEYDAGLDLYSANDDVYIYPGGSELFDTGVHVQLPKNTVGFLKPYKVCRGDKISQLVILPCFLPELEVVSSLEETERGDNGFGSSGR